VRYVVLLDGTTTVLWKELATDLINMIVDERTMTLKVYFVNIATQKQTERAIKCRTKEQIEIVGEKLLKIATDNKNDLRVTKALSK
jgi:hypothetical protein